jgi:hypothetical protein
VIWIFKKQKESNGLGNFLIQKIEEEVKKQETLFEYFIEEDDKSEVIEEIKQTIEEKLNTLIRNEVENYFLEKIYIEKVKPIIEKNIHLFEEFEEEKNFLLKKIPYTHQTVLSLFESKGLFTTILYYLYKVKFYAGVFKYKTLIKRIVDSIENHYNKEDLDKKLQEEYNFFKEDLKKLKEIYPLLEKIYLYIVQNGEKYVKILEEGLEYVPIKNIKITINETFNLRFKNIVYIKKSKIIAVKMALYKERDKIFCVQYCRNWRCFNRFGADLFLLEKDELETIFLDLPKVERLLKEKIEERISRNFAEIIREL